MHIRLDRFNPKILKVWTLTNFEHAMRENKLPDH